MVLEFELGQFVCVEPTPAAAGFKDDKARGLLTAVRVTEGSTFVSLLQNTLDFVTLEYSTSQEATYPVGAISLLHFNAHRHKARFILMQQLMYSPKGEMRSWYSKVRRQTAPDGQQVWRADINVPSSSSAAGSSGASRKCKRTTQRFVCADRQALAAVMYDIALIRLNKPAVNTTPETRALILKELNITDSAVQDSVAAQLNI